MATLTSVQSGPWTDAATWGGSVPADGDSVTIQAAHTVTFDADHSAYATGVSLTLDGMLQASDTPGAYTLKLASNLGGGGTLQAGTSLESPYPLACTITILLNGYVITLDDVALYCAEPTRRVVALTAPATVGQTALAVEADVSADTWAVGDSVQVVNDYNAGAALDVETHTLSAISPNTLTLSSGLVADKVTGARVALISRNVRIVGTGSEFAFNGAGGHIFAEINTVSRGLYVLDAATQAGGVIVNAANGMQACSDLSYRGVISQASLGGLHSSVVYLQETALLACGTAITPGSQVIAQQGEIYGSANAVIGTGLTAHSMTFQGCGTGFTRSTAQLYDCVLGDSLGYALSFVLGELVNSRIETTVEYSTAAQLSPGQWLQSTSHDQTPGALKVWTRGGTVTSVSSPVRAGRARSYQLAGITPGEVVYFQEDVALSPGQSITFDTWWRKDASADYLPRLVIFPPEAEPLLGDAVLQTFTMSDSIDTWEAFSGTLHNTDTIPRRYRFRWQAGAGNAYADYQFGSPLRVVVDDEPLNVWPGEAVHIELSYTGKQTLAGQTLNAYLGSGVAQIIKPCTVTGTAGDYTLSFSLDREDTETLGGLYARYQVWHAGAGLLIEGPLRVYDTLRA